MQTRDARAARPDRRVQPRGLHRDAAPARLAARAARGGDRAVRAVPAAGAEGAEADAAGARSSAPRCARELLDAGEELAAQLLDYHDRERKPVWWAFFDRLEMTPDELVEDAESIGRLELDRRAGAASKRSQRVHVHLPAAGAQARRGPGRHRPGDARSAGEIIELDRDARRLVLKRGPSLDDVPLPRGARSPAGRLRHRRPGGRARAHRPLAARGRPPLPGARVDPAPRAVRPRRADDRPRRDEGARALARRAPPRHPGAARLGQDVDVGPADRAT